jgi:hypothetical protein
MKAETGQYDASLGQKSNETSGRAIMARQREGDTATYHYVDNLARAVRHLGRIILDLIPHIYDTQRIALILGEDDSQANVTIDPANPEALTEYRDEQGEIKRIFNPNIGTYDIYTTTGPSFTTRRMEAVDAMTAMTQANPQLWQVIGDLLVKSMDWPGAEEMADRLKLTLLPNVQAEIDKDEQQPEVPPQVQQAMEQMQGQVQQLDQVIQQMQSEVEKAEQEKNAAILKAQQAQAESMSLKLEIQKRDALDQIEEAQEVSEEQTESIDQLELAKQQALDARERFKIEQQTAADVRKAEIQATAQIEVARISHTPVIPEQDNETLGMIAQMVANQQELMAHVAKPKASQVRIVKQADGSFVGEKIEG